MHIRFRFAKLGKIRFTSQRDVARMWERALRRARLPLAYTRGFSPRPRLSFGLALPTGCESEAEYLDVVLDTGRPGTAPVDPAALPGPLSALLPDGVVVHEAAAIAPGEGSLQELVTSCSWSLDLGGVTRAELDELVDGLLGANSVPVTRERKGRVETDDIRPSVLTLSGAACPAARTHPGPATVRLLAELATRPRGLRPVELVRGLAVAGSGRTTATPVLDRACRTRQWIERDATRVDPLEGARRPGAERAGLAWERAS